MEVFKWKDFCRNGSLYTADHLKIRTLPELPLHTHEFCELLFIERKTGVQTINGREQLLSEGSLSLLYPMADTHGITDFDSGFSVIWIYFHSNILTELEQRYRNEKIGETIRDHRMNLLALGPGEIRWFQQTFENLKNTQNSRFELERFLMNLFAIISRYSPEDKSVDELPDWLKKALGNYNNPELYRRGVRGFLELTNRSMEHVNRELKKHLGKTTTQVINEKRMYHAENLLTSSQRTILDICYECGYDSPAYFHKVFKAGHRMSPSEFRKQEYHTPRPLTPERKCQ